MIDKEKMKTGDLVLVQNNGLVTIAKYNGYKGENRSSITHLFIIEKPYKFNHVEVNQESRTYSNDYLTKLIDYNSLKYLI
jgi:hypothetical protein